MHFVKLLDLLSSSVDFYSSIKASQACNTFQTKLGQQSFYHFVMFPFVLTTRRTVRHWRYQVMRCFRRYFVPFCKLFFSCATVWGRHCHKILHTVFIRNRSGLQKGQSSIRTEEEGSVGICAECNPPPTKNSMTSIKKVCSICWTLREMIHPRCLEAQRSQRHLWTRLT